MRRTAPGSVLKRIALMAITLFEKSLVQVIVEPISRSISSHRHSFLQCYNNSSNCVCSVTGWEQLNC